MRRFHVVGSLGALALWLSAAPSHAYYYLVSTTAYGVGVTGCSISEAVKAAATNASNQDGCVRQGTAGNNTVGVPSGTYKLQGVIQVKSSLSIVGEVANNSLATHITRDPAVAGAQGFRVSVGLAGNSYVNFKDMVIRNFLHTDQPAVLVDATQSAGFDRVVLKQNEASSGLGGAIRAETSAYIYVTRSWLDQNVAARAGAIRGMTGATIEIVNTTLSKNQATQEAGAVWADYLMCDQCTFAQNKSTNRFGGAIYVPGTGSANIYRSTFTENTASVSAPNIYVSGTGSYVYMSYSVMLNAAGVPDCAGLSGTSINSGGYNAISVVSGNCTIAPTTGDQFNVTPTLNTYYSAAGPGPVWVPAVLPKPAFGCGNLLDKAPAYGSTDQYGNPRTRDYAGCNNSGANVQDIGAIEIQ